MRYVILSDTHGDVSKMLAAVDFILALKPDAGIFLGDVCADAYLLQKELDIPFTIVAGNCDAGISPYPSTAVVESEGVRIFACHGHQYDVYEGVQRLMYAAQERECAVALYGHTHHQEKLKEEGILFVNPGSIARPRLSAPGLALLDVKDGHANAILLPFFADQQKKDHFF